MSWWDRVKERLGLEGDYEDEYYEDDGYYDADASDEEDAWNAPSGRASQQRSLSGPTTGVRRVDRGLDAERAHSSSSSLRSVPTGSASVTPVAPQVKMHIIEPKSYSEAQSIADKFKQGTPVILNMTFTKPELAKRFIDFASGLTYGLDGGLQKVSDKVFMLTPHNVDVSAVDRQRLRDTGLFSMDK